MRCNKKANLPLFEIALVFVRFDDVARVIVNANHTVMWSAEEEVPVADEIFSCAP